MAFINKSAREIRVKIVYYGRTLFQNREIMTDNAILCSENLRR